MMPLSIRVPAKKSTTIKAILGLALALAFAAPVLSTSVSAKSPDSAKPAAAATKTPLLDLNSASKAELRELKGIGDKRADDIIKGRPYKGKDELVQKKIIPQAVYDAIKDKIIAKQK